MILSVPFYENNEDGNQCMQVAMKSILKYFLDKDFSLEELDKLTGRKKGFWTWICQCVTVLYESGLDVKYYSNLDMKTFLQGEKFIQKQYGKDANKILKFTDLPVLLDSIKNLMKYNLFEKRKMSFEEIESHIKQGHVPLVVIDSNKLLGKRGLYQGHFVIVTGFDNQNVFYHDSGPTNPEANKKVLKSTFIKAWNPNGTYNEDVVIVYGKR